MLVCTRSRLALHLLEFFGELKAHYLLVLHMDDGVNRRRWLLIQVLLHAHYSILHLKDACDAALLELSFCKLIDQLPI